MMKLEKIFFFLLLLPAVLSTQNNIHLFGTCMKVRSTIYQFNGNKLVGKKDHLLKTVQVKKDELI